MICAKKINLTIIAIIFLLIPFFGLKAANLSDSGDYLEHTGREAGFDTSQNSIDPVVANIINIALSFLGVLFLLLIIYGGFIWMTARGNEDQVDKAKNIITAAVIGLIIVIGAYAISVFVVEKLSDSYLRK